MKKLKKILIVGATGFIGYHLAKKSLKYNWQVTSVSTQPPKKIRFLKNVKYLFCDISKKKDLEKKIKPNYDYVVNLGGYVNHSNKTKTYNSHYLGLRNLTNIFLKNPPKKFIQMGSSVEYGNNKSPQKESFVINPKSLKSVYGKAKLLSTLHLVKLYKKKKFPSIILRLFLTYGPKQDVNRFIPIIVNECIKNNSFKCSNGKQFRDFIFIDDLINAIIKILNSSGLDGEIFNIGFGKPEKIKRIIETIKQKIGKGKPLYGKIKLRKDEILRLYPSIKKIKKKLNWVPKIKIQEGLKKTISYYNENKKSF